MVWRRRMIEWGWVVSARANLFIVNFIITFVWTSNAKHGIMAKRLKPLFGNMFVHMHMYASHKWARNVHSFNRLDDLIRLFLLSKNGSAWTRTFVEWSWHSVSSEVAMWCIEFAMYEQKSKGNSASRRYCTAMKWSLLTFRIKHSWEPIRWAPPLFRQNTMNRIRNNSVIKKFKDNTHNTFASTTSKPFFLPPYSNEYIFSSSFFLFR